MNGQNDLMGGLTAATQPMPQPMTGGLFNAAGGFSPLQAGTLSPLDPLYNYAQTAPILSLQGNDRNETLNFQARPNQNYQLTIGGQVVGSASTPEEVARLVDMANQASSQGGKAIDVRLQEQVQTATPTGGPATAFNDVYANKPNNNGQLDFILPAALAAISGGALGPLLGGGFLGTGAAAGLGSIGGSLGTGDTLKNALIKGAISGVTAGALSGLGAAAPGVSEGVSAAAPTVGSGAAGAVGAGAAPVAGEILVQAARPLLGSALSSGIGAGLGNIGGSLATDTSLGRLADAYNQPPAAEGALQPELMSTASRAAPTSGASMAGTLVPNLLPYIPGYTGNEELLSTAPRPDRSSGWALPLAATGASGAAAAAGPGVTTYSPPASVEAMQANAANMPAADPMITVTNSTGATGSLNAALPGLAMTVPAMTAANAVTGGAAGGKGLLGSTAGKVSAGLTALDFVTDLLGINTGRKNNGNTLGPGAGSIGSPSSLGSVFGGKLPAPGAAFSGQSFAPRDMSGVDFSRYGYGPAQSFFENVPRNPQEYRDAMTARAAPPAMVQPQDNDIAGYIRRLVPGVTDAQIAAVMQSPEGQELLGIAPDMQTFAEGGMLAAQGGSRSSTSRAVKGPGTGRSDEIPALLSDGEYVIDAETVAMLGDGSSEAGAERLDDFRVSIRKHKGRNLAKGEFSANAKRPENYLSGGRV